MRTLKKSLCLVLAVVMMFSLCAFGASADTDFTDYSEIKYTQAVDLLTSMGVITGYEDGTFDPDGTLTRAEGCAIIARLLDQADVSGATSFTDVPSSHWAVDYIAYCAAEGIVAGYGDGTFGPDDTLTGYQWMKMLLCAAGYNASYENMTGTSWSIGVATLAKDQDVTDGISGVSYSTGVSRDVACKLAFNMAINATAVTWKSQGGLSVSGDGFTVTQEETGSYTYHYEDDDNSNPEMTFIEWVWDADVTEGERDDFGRPSTNYVIDDLNIDMTIADSPVATLSAKTSAGNVASALSGYKIYVDGLNEKNINNSTKYTSAKLYVEYYYENGNSGSNSDHGDSDTYYQVLAKTTDKNQTLADFLSGLTAAGKVVEFYEGSKSADEDGIITDIIVVEYTVGEVTKVSTSGTSTTYTVQAADGTGGKESGFIDSDDHSDDTAVLTGASSVDEDDIVTYAVANDVLYIYPTTSIEGYYSGYSTGNYAAITVDGTRYTIARGVVWNGTTGELISDNEDEYYFSIFGDTGNDTTIYLDQFGNAVWSDETAAAASDFVYVLGVSPNESVIGDDDYEVGYITQEGTTGIVYSEDNVVENAWYKMSKDGSYYEFKTSSNYSTLTGKLYNSRLNSSQATIAYTDSGDAIRANSSTVFILKTDGNTYKVYSGLSKVRNYKNFTETPNAVALLKNNSSYATAIYVDVTQGQAASSNTDDVIFLIKQSGSGYDSAADETYYTYTAIVDGESTTINSTTDTDSIDSVSSDIRSSFVFGLYTFSIDSDGYYEIDDEVTYDGTDYQVFYVADYVEADDNAIEFSGGVLSFQGTVGTDGTVVTDVSLTVDDDAIVGHISSLNSLSTVVVGDGYELDGEANGTGHLYVVYDSNGVATELYYVGSID